jgi:hypothetical protein
MEGGRLDGRIQIGVFLPPLVSNVLFPHIPWAVCPDIVFFHRRLSVTQSGGN